MNLAQFDTVCQRFPGAALAIQWGGSRVYKVGGKMFALGNRDAGVPYCVFKTTPIAYEMLLDQGLATRAPYLPRGFCVKIGDPDALPDDDLAGYFEQSYRIVAGSLPKLTRKSLGLG
ncbi:MmcQ/YjbR family DNA-binding protein [Acidiphilium sp. AL]|uniref:MmcQ/YjbR family DNA-binding protein n=1 Tax=Acidiphilium sp. AL TaxID=2871704 RepID=UPI0021CB4BB3|nr:MmcQ/YjbR family DNA-binding protein [Acidiphilium sp. AL]MCU4161053.1 MmcQ/YjbR family DNA-binding protein [Acidiphilium sp. AL]